VQLQADISGTVRKEMFRRFQTRTFQNNWVRLSEASDLVALEDSNLQPKDYESKVRICEEMQKLATDHIHYRYSHQPLRGLLLMADFYGRLPQKCQRNHAYR
jgi:hypothetical protein